MTFIHTSPRKADVRIYTCPLSAIRPVLPFFVFSSLQQLLLLKDLAHIYSASSMKILFAVELGITIRIEKDIQWLLLLSAASHLVQ
jgi:hypothetical protein